jgi:hypothetical protein
MYQIRAVNALLNIEPPSPLTNFTFTSVPSIYVENLYEESGYSE